MPRKQQYSKKDLCIQAGFDIEDDFVWAYGERFPIVDPIAIHLKTYRTNPSAETRYEAMKNAFITLWPQYEVTYNYWMERIFREHVNHESEFISLASGGGCGKSQTMAYVAILFWLALPKDRAVIVTSTTLESLGARIFGYIERAFEEIAIPYPVRVKKSPSPKIQDYHNPSNIAGIFGVAAKSGPEEKAVQEIKGRHPKNGIMLILDEAPDMPIGIMNAVPNLKKALEDRFQGFALGNATSTTDLHGIVSTPRDERKWDAIDPHKIFRWETTQPNGVCLYFNPYDSPAIHETDPKRKAALSKFLITEEKLIKAERDEGPESESFWRMTMGYWRNRSTDATIVSESFLKDYNPTTRAEFSGQTEQHIVAGLDPAFSTGGDKCILRLGVLGHHVNGNMVLDFLNDKFLFHIKINAYTGKSAELQIADKVIEICNHYKVPLNTLCVDANGAGRGLADIIQLRSGGILTPRKIYSSHIKGKKANDLDLTIVSTYELWFKGREFIANKQIHGLDLNAYNQLHTRLIINKEGKKLLEKKDEYRQRMGKISDHLGRSPDEADAAMLCIQSACMFHGFYPGQRKAYTRYSDPVSKAFDEARRRYTEDMRMKQTEKFVLKGGYSGTLQQLVNKKWF